MPDDPIHGRHGLHGRDGRDGKNGRDGKSVDPATVARLVEQSVARAAPSLRGDIGATGPQGESGPPGISVRGEPGPQGPQGADGDIGPMPRHEWRYAGGAVQLRFERPGAAGVAVWGAWSENLRGAVGMSGGWIGGGSSGSSSSSSSDGSVPYFVAADETYEVTIYRQALFARTIDVEGYVDLEGDLVMVN